MRQRMSKNISKKNEARLKIYLEKVEKDKSKVDKVSKEKSKPKQ
jgi:hypothetical protein